MSIGASSTWPDGDQKVYFQPRRLGHVNLWVEDVDISERFYNQTCGLNVEFTEPDLIASFLGTGHTPHDLGMMETTKGVNRYGRDGLLQLPGTIGLKPGLNHLAWELENEAELVAGWRRLQADKIETDITVDHQVAHSIYMFDPDGNYNEFYCDTLKDWRSLLSGPMELLTSKWDPDVAEPFTDGRYDEHPELRRVEGAPVEPYRVTHAVLETARIDEMLRFYSTVGGLHIVKRLEGAIYLAGTLDAYRYSLILVPAAAPCYHHVGFELKDEETLQRCLDRLAAKGLVPERVVDLPWKHSFFLIDPDGQLSEWYVRRGELPDVAERGDVPLAFAV
ncbi:VOC family protein [Paraburkholderia ferrariae]|jgi:catechol 2,3-dioxygenase|uniref:VOC family protein n=1 Tax=Paraburkholderia ferrariae TaxID=386056 RepID=UPI0005A92EBA|nr:VOC family protein [Paraburkholderia ferrariae]